MKGQKRVLIVEDDATDTSIMMKAFQAAPAWEVKLATDGEAALDMMGFAGRGKWGGGWRPDVVVLNLRLRLPKLTGDEDRLR
jgi:DNA-binding response OmpR family regulator